MAGKTKRARSTAHWKNCEKRVADEMAGVRINRGEDFSAIDPDGESDHWVWDAKSWAAHSALKLFWKCQVKYAEHTGARGFLLWLHERGTPTERDVVVLDAATFTALCRAAGRL